jgi:hypothetical protein
MGNDGRTPFQAQVLFAFSDQQPFGGQNIATVPDGKRLVIEYVSATGAITPADKKIIHFFLETKVAGVDADHVFVPFATGRDYQSGYANYAGGQRVRIYADPGTGVFAGAFRNTSTGRGDVSFKVSGYLTDTL